MVLTPCAKALADQCSDESSQCVTVNVGGTTVTYPTLQLTPVATAYVNSTGGYSISLAQGSQTTVDLNTVATSTGLSSSQVAHVISTLPSTSALVYSRLSTLNNMLDVAIFKTVRKGNVTTLYSAKFTPQMGKRWSASKTFMTSAEKLGGGPGPDPFQQFEGGDQEFHNVPTNSPYVAQTITGMAARYVNAQMAMLSMANFTEKTWVTTAHHFFTTTTTTHDAGYETPIWLVGLPPASNTAGDISANYCLDALSGTTCPTPEHQVVSGLAWSDWSQGNLPSSQTTIHEFTQSHTGFNFLTFILVVGSLAFGISGVVSLFIHSNEQNGDNVAKDVQNLLGVNFEVLGNLVAGDISSQVGAAIGTNSYVSTNDTSATQTGPFVSANLGPSTAATNPSGTFSPSSSYETYFQSIEKQAITATPGQSTSQNDSSGNNGFAAFSTFDQGFTNDIQPSPSVNLQFNSIQYIQDTK